MHFSSLQGQQLYILLLDNNLKFCFFSEEFVDDYNPSLICCAFNPPNKVKSWDNLEQ